MLNLSDILKCAETINENESNILIHNFKILLFLQSKLKFKKLKEVQDKFEFLLSTCQALTNEIESLHEAVCNKTEKLKSNSHKRNLLKTLEQNIRFINSKKVGQKRQLEKIIKKTRETLKQKKNLYSNKIQAISCYLSNRLADLESSLEAHLSRKICLLAFDANLSLVTKKFNEIKFSKI
jgi:hypothetical protein